MADNDDFDLDDFNLDEFDFDEFDINPENVKDDRKPTAVIKDSAIEGFRGALTDKNAIRRAMEKSLPREYESTFEAMDTVSDVKSQIEDAMEPVAKQAKQVARQNKELLNKFLPKKMAEKLESWTEDTGSGGYENIDPRAAEVGATLSDIFKLNQEKDTEAREIDQENDAKQYAIKEEAETKRHLGQVEVLEAIRSGIARQTDYQDQILTKYQQKHLELTYKQLYSLQDLLELSKRKAESDNTSLANIVKNTGLPETQKIKAFEEAQREISADLRREAVEGAAGYVRNLGGKMIGNTITSVTDRLKSTLSSISDMTGMTDNPDMSIGDMLGSMIGSSAGQALMEKSIAKAMKALGQDADESNVKRMGARLALMFQEAPERLLAWSQSGSGRTGLAGFLENFLKDQIPSFSRINRVDIEQIADADEAATFTNRVARSITDVIPGYLSLQLHQLRLLVSGGEPVDKIEYNPETGQFGSAKDKAKTLESRLFGGHTDKYQRNLNDAVDGLLGGADVTDDQKKELENFLYDHLSNNKPARVSDLVKGLNRSDYVQDDNKKLLGEILTKNVYDSTGNHYQSATIQNQTRELNTKVSDLRGSVPYIKEIIDEMINAGYRNDLIEMGVIDTKGQIDHDIVSSKLSGRTIAKRGSDGTFKNRVEAGNRDLADADNMAVRGVQNTRANMEERRAASVGQAQEVTAQETITQDLIEAIKEASDQQVLRLSELVSGQTTQSDKLDALTQGLGTLGGARPNTDELAAIRQAIEDCCIKEETSEQTELLRQILAVIPEAAAMSGPYTEKTQSVFKSITSRVGKFAKYGADALQTYYKGAFGLMGKVVETAGDLGKPVMEGGGSLLRSIGERLTKGKAEAEELFVKGKAGAVIYMSKLRAGEYIDALTGKTITTIEELKAAKGDIKNQAGEVVLTVEERAKGLYDKHGKGILGKSVELLKKYYETLWGGTRGLVGGIPPIVRAIYGAAKGFLTREKDIYVKGEGSPRLLATLLIKGHYRLQSTGKSIYSHKDIDGAVIDPTGRVVLAVEELEKVVGPDGEPIRSLVEKGVDLVKSYYSAVWGATKGVAKWIGGSAIEIKDRLMGKAIRGTVMDEDQAERTWTYWDEQLQILRRLDLRFTDGPVGDMDFGGVGPDAPTTPGQLALPAPAGYESADADFEPSPSSGPRKKASDVFAKTKDRAKEMYGRARDKVTDAAEVVKGKRETTPNDEPKPDLVGSVTEKVTNVVGSLKDKFTGLFSKTDEHEEERNKDRDQQTGLLSKLTELTGKRTEKLDELQQSQLDSQKKMTETLKGIEENTDKEELREGGWKSRLAKARDRFRGSGSDEDSEDETKLGKASKSMGYEKKSITDIMLGPFGSIVEKFGEYMGMFKGAIGGLTGWLGAKLLGKGVGTAADAAADVAGSGGKKGIMGRLWGGAKSLAKKGGSLALRAAPVLLSAAGSIGSAVGAGAAAVGSVLSAPVVLGAIAVAGVAYGGYKLYQYATKYKPQVLDKLRFAQYGFDIGSEENRKFVLPLEEYLNDNVSWENGVPQIKPDPSDDTLAKLLGLTGENEAIDPQKAAKWFQDRMLPIWSTHRAILKNQYDDKVSLSDVDDLDSHQKRSFLDSLSQGLPQSMFSGEVSPFKNASLDFTQDQVKAMHAWALDTLNKDDKKVVIPGKRAYTPDAEKPQVTPSSQGALYDPRPTEVGQPRSTSKSGGSYWGGFSVKELKNSVASSKAKTPYILSIKRYKETANSTISDAALIDKGTGHKVLEFKFLERPGPDTKEPNQRLRIPEGSYKLKWQTQTGLAGVRPHLPVPWLYGSGVSEDRHIYIHNGNYPRQTDGCLLCGKDEAPDMVTSSVDTLNRLKSELMNIGIENVTVEVSSAYKGKRQVAATQTQTFTSLPSVGTVENWSAEETQRLASWSLPGTASDDRGQSPIDRPGSASEREKGLLASVPKDWVSDEDKAAAEASVEAQHPDKDKRQLSSLVDIELTKLANQRKRDWVSENGISNAAAVAAGILPDPNTSAQAKVHSYGSFQEQTTPVVYRPEAPALTEKPKRMTSTETRDEVSAHNAKASEQEAQKQDAMREQSMVSQKIDREKRQQLETASRIESVLTKQLSTQRHMSDNLDKLVLLAEGRFQQATDKSPAEYLVKRGYRPPQPNQKEPFKPIVDLSS